jgi:hypothetical protein
VELLPLSSHAKRTAGESRLIGRALGPAHAALKTLQHRDLSTVNVRVRVAVQLDEVSTIPGPEGGITLPFVEASSPAR